MPSCSQEQHRVKTRLAAFAERFGPAFAALIEPETEIPEQLVEAVRIMLRKTSSNAILGFDRPNPTSGYGFIDPQKAVEMAKIFSAQR